MITEKLFHYQLNKLGDKSLRFPKTLFFLILGISLFGVLVLYSAGGLSFYPYAYKQLLFLALFAPLIYIIALFDIKTIYHYSYLIYFVLLIPLIFVSIVGHKAMGATRWIDLGLFKYQPSEVMKLGCILALARYYHSADERNINYPSGFVVPGLILLLPMFFILKQPDLGSSIITLFTGGAIIFCAGLSYRYFVAAFLAGMGSLPLVWYMLKDYQKQRVMTFLDPESDPLGASYNIIQSKIAIGSGGIFGKGFGKGTQTQLDFLPEHQTDFVFTMIMEELGFLFALLIFITYFFIIFYTMMIAVHSRSSFGRLVAIGVASMTFIHVFVNIGMVSGIVPVVGKPLPFLSFGGSSLGAMLISFGFVANVHTNQSTYITKSF